MTDDDQKRMAERVAKLLRTAEHPNTPPAEAEAAAAKAAAIMEKYAIDELLVAKARGAVLTDVLVRKEFNYKGVYFYADVALTSFLAEAMGLRAIYSKLGGSHVKVNVLGFERDYDRFKVLLTTAMLQRSNATNTYIRTHPMWDLQTASQKYNTKRSFMVGFANGLAEKVKAASQQVHQEVVREHGSGAELVLVDRKDQVNKFFASEYPRTGTGRGVKITGSYGAGVKAGQSMNIGGTGLGGQRKALG